MIDPKVIEELKAKHGEIYRLEHLGHEVVVRLPSSPEWLRFKEMQADEGRRSKAPAQLVRDTCVFPDAQSLEVMLNKYPGLADTFAGEVAEVAGLSKKAQREKL